jgi:NitT/TauT family transport system substrate-binding protein
VASLEDGLYVLEPNLKDKAFVAKMAKFLKASFKGWNDAVKNPEAAKIVVAQDASGSATLAVQKRQMENVAKLISNAGTPKIGYLDPAAYERTVKVLLSGGSSPVIKKDPGTAAMTTPCGTPRRSKPAPAPDGLRTGQRARTCAMRGPMP